MKVGFQHAGYTGDTTGLGTTAPPRDLRGRRALLLLPGFEFGDVRLDAPPQGETTPFHPCSLYAAPRYYGYWLTVNYRHPYDLSP